jgi:hypothetical protein
MAAGRGQIDMMDTTSCSAGTPARAHRLPIRRAAALAGTAAVLTLAGCGSSSSSGSSGGLSKAALTKRVDPICTQHYDKISAAAAKLLAGGHLPNPRKFGMFVMMTVIPQYNAVIGKLGGLKPAESIRPKYEHWLADSHATSGKLQRDPAMLQHASSFAAVNHEADALGFTSKCHVGPG